MAGYWELWDLETSNALADFDTESEGLAYVRELMSQGWKASDLTFFYDDPAVEVEDLPPAISGEELAVRAQTAGSDQVRQSA